MKHAGAEALAQLQPLLAALRDVDGLIERKPGIFYKGSKARLHFHEDATGLFADLKVGRDWERFAVSTAAGQATLLERVR